MCYCTSGYLMRENSAYTQKHFPFQSAIPAKVHTNTEQHTQYTDPEKNPVSLHILQSLGISNYSGDQKKKIKRTHQRTSKKRLALGKETDHLCPAVSQPNSQHCPEAASFPWRMLCNIGGRVALLLFEGQAVQSDLVALYSMVSLPM